MGGTQGVLCPCRLQESFEANKDDGAFEAQYKKLLEEIQQIYESAKEFHSKVRREGGLGCTGLHRGAKGSWGSCAPLTSTQWWSGGSSAHPD